MNQALYAHMNNKRKMKKKIKYGDVDLWLLRDVGHLWSTVWGPLCGHLAMLSPLGAPVFFYFSVHPSGVGGEEVAWPRVLQSWQG
jgi:hypothetical protein